MPSISNPMKVAATQGYGAKVYFSGSTAPEREALADEVMEKTGARMVPPYDHPDVILGQGKPPPSVSILCDRTSPNNVAGGGGRGASRDSCESNDLHGTGTAGIELQEQVAEQLAAESSSKKGLDAIITPCGGGGLTSGVALSVRPLPPRPPPFLYPPSPPASRTNIPDPPPGPV